MICSLKTKILLIGLACCISACTPTIDNHGYESDQICFKKISLGTPEHEVLMKLGSPSTVSTFSPKTWYYVTKVTERKAFFHPKILKQQVIAVQFNERGVVTNIREIQPNDYKEITPNKNVTPSAGYQSSFLKEIFSNFGRMNSKSTPQK